jgi:alpha-beta hydrolase superfamily lysophospholipase
VVAIAQTAHTAEDATVTNPDDGTTIAITVFKPAGASATAPAPVILHSHGWGGSRSTTIGGAIEQFLDAGIGAVSIDQRGHGDSEGQAHVQDPTRETEDIKAVIDFIAALDWVRLDGPGDPVLGAIGGSYGGGYQTMTALDEIADEGRTRFNALAPEITWYDLPESLAPQGVPRSAWLTLLYAVGAPMVPQFIHEAQAWGTATGWWPDGTVLGQPAPGVPDIDSVFHEHSPIAFAERDIRIDVPVLFRQGISDNLFNLNQGIHLLQDAVTDEAQEESYLVGYNGGHALPNVLPRGSSGGSDACSPGSFTELSIQFFQRVFSQQSTSGLLPERYNLTTADGSRCLSLGNFKGGETFPVDLTGTGNTVTTTGLGAPLHVPVTTGPITVTGIPTLSGTATALGIDSRAFFGLSMGTSPADAVVITNNLMPLRLPLPVADEAFEIELPGVAVEVPEGQTLFLTITPVSDMSIYHGSRTPGGLVLAGLELDLPAPKGCGPPEGKGPKDGRAIPCGPKS